MKPGGLLVEGLVAGYDRLIVLHEVDFEVSPGDLLAVIGANGAGKSTLLRAISGLLPSKAGRVVVAGHDVTGLATEQIVRLGLGHVPENRLVFTSLSVEDNLQLGAWTQGKNASRRSMLLEMFPRLQERINVTAGSLSGGEQQMLALARALMGEPSVLILDEPSLGLAPLLVGEIMSSLKRLKDELGLTVLLIEQNANAAFQVADDVIVLERGRVVLEGKPADLRANDAVRNAYLGI